MRGGSSGDKSAVSSDLIETADSGYEKRANSEASCD
jgi:hypothetical protein